MIGTADYVDAIVGSDDVCDVVGAGYADRYSNADGSSALPAC